MAGKKGTLLGRALLRFIPEASPFHAIAEAVDQTAETVIFDHDKGQELPILQHGPVENFKFGAAKLLTDLAEKGLITLNFPGQARRYPSPRSLRQ